MNLNLVSLLLVFFGGGIGASFRFLIVQLSGSSFYSVLIPNLVGCALIGFTSQFLGANENLRLLFIVGFLGGFTTFSSYMLFLGNNALSVQNFFFFLAHNLIGFSVFYLGSKVAQSLA